MQVAHIWPYAVNCTEAKCEELRFVFSKNLLTMDENLSLDLGEILAPDSGEVGSTDVECNLVTMRHDVHQMWSEARFALKYIGNEASTEKDGYSTFQIQWLWMSDRVHAKLDSQHLGCPKRQRGDTKGKHCSFELTIDLESREKMNALHRALVDTYKQASNTSCRGATVRDHEGRLIQSGQIFQLQARTQDLPKVKILLDTQLLAIKMASLCGAAEDADYLDREPPPVWRVDWDAMWRRYYGEEEGEGSGSEETTSAEELEHESEDE